MKTRSTRHTRIKIPWQKALRIAKIAVLSGGLFFIALFVAARALPLPSADVPLATIVYDTEGRVAARLFEQNRIEVTRDQMPVYLRQAIVAIEDERFYQHWGIDPIAILRALRADLLARQIVEGGSTITQQLAKNMFLSHQRTILRKLHEAIITMQLETRHTKEEILTMYLNIVYFGHGAYGVEAAAHTYFGKNTSELTLGESSLLCGIVQMPEILSPYRNLEGALRRRSIVLDKMVEQRFITAEQAEQARQEQFRFVGLRVPEAPYFVDYMMNEIRRRHPEVATNILTAGYVIHATIDNDFQAAAERAFLQGIGPGTPDARGVEQPQGALIAIDPSNGYIKALVGGRDYAKSTYNRAFQAQRQPGSAMKPFLYAALIDMGIPATRTQRCEEVEYRGATRRDVYKPQDYGPRPYHNRQMGMREALQISDNVVAVRWANEVGPRRIADYAKRMGIESALEPNLSLALGSSEVTPLELCVAYATFANLGLRVEPMSIISIKDRFGNVIERNAPRISRAISEPVAYVVTHLMTSVLMPGGTGSHLAPIIRRPAAGKSGTTDKLRDAWFVGFTPEIVAAVYIGHDEPVVAVGATGGAKAGPIWARFVAEALRQVPPRDFPRPVGVVELDVCRDTGLLPNRTCPSVREVFVSGTEPRTRDQTVHWDNIEQWGGQQGVTPRRRGLADGTENLDILENLLEDLLPLEEAEDP